MQCRSCLAYPVSSSSRHRVSTENCCNSIHSAFGGSHSVPSTLSMVALKPSISTRLRNGDKRMPGSDSDGRFALSVVVTLGAGEGVGRGLTARDDGADFECPRNQPLNFFSGLLSLDMALRPVCLMRKGSRIYRSHTGTWH